MTNPTPDALAAALAACVDAEARTQDRLGPEGLVRLEDLRADRADELRDAREREDDRRRAAAEPED